MRFNITNELTRDSLVSHIVLHGLSHAADKTLIHRVADDGGVKGDGVSADLVLTVNGEELPLESFCDHWQGQVDRMIKEEAARLAKDMFYDLSEMCQDLERRVGEEIDSRLEDWERSALKSD